MPDPPQLRFSREDVDRALSDRIKVGEALLEAVWSTADVPRWRDAEARYGEWNDYNELMLRKMFTSDELAAQYRQVSLDYTVGATQAEERRAAADMISLRIDCLRSTLGRLDLFDVAQRELQRDESPVASSNRIFIVHSGEHALKEAVARMVTRLGYDPVILHEQPDLGKTVIDKYESEAANAAFAVVLFTPDDDGRLRDPGRAYRLLPRARQNVVFELGYFVGKLGRGRVAALMTDSAIERPSDVAGVLYINVEALGAVDWRINLAREMKAAGLDIDLDHLYPE